jgi:hypothetical protein
MKRRKLAIIVHIEGPASISPRRHRTATRNAIRRPLQTGTGNMLRRRCLTISIPALAVVHVPALASAQQRPVIRVFRDPGCECCRGWASHLEEAGFDVRLEERPPTDPVRRASGAPRELMGCHTAFCEHLAFEGRVPIEAVRRFMAAPGPWRGLAVPGMPVGSPGMVV